MENTQDGAAPSATRLPGVVIAAVVVKLALHAVALTGYGWFRDEFYYLACARRLAWGYVDHPPLSVALLAAVTAVLGDSLAAVRVVPVLAGAVLVVIAALLAREMGGGRVAQGLAALAVVCAPVYLAINGFYSMNSLDMVAWSAAALLVLRALRLGTKASWIALGLVLGLGLLNKLSILWLGAGLAAGLLLTGERRVLRTAGPWIAAALALVLLLPHVLWQVAHGWPTAEFVRNASTDKMAVVAPLAFLGRQVMAMNPASALLWLPGLVLCLRAREDRRLRVLGILYLVVLAILVQQGTSRTEYLTPAYPMLLAAGAVAWERWTARRRAWLALPAVLMVAFAALALPMVVPILPVPRLLAWQEALGETPRSAEKKAVGPLSQHYADMHGWQEMADAVGAVAARLDPQDRATAAVFAQNYGEAGALEHLGRGLPRVVSGHNNYWLWGPGPEPTVVIVLGGERNDVEAIFTSVEEAGRTSCDWCMPYERDLPIYVARGPRMPIAELWPRVKHFD